MLWYLLTRDPNLAFIIDVVILTALGCVAAYLGILLWKYGYWIKIGKARFVVLGIGRDKLLRFIIPETHHGLTLKLGKYGEVMVKPEAVLRIFGSKTLATLVYSPYAFSLDPEKLAGLSKCREKGCKEEVTIEPNEKVVIRIDDVEKWLHEAIDPLTFDALLTKEFSAGLSIGRKAAEHVKKLVYVGIVFIIIFGIIMFLLLAVGK